MTINYRIRLNFSNASFFNENPGIWLCMHLVLKDVNQKMQTENWKRFNWHFLSIKSHINVLGSVFKKIVSMVLFLYKVIMRSFHYLWRKSSSKILEYIHTETAVQRCHEKRCRSVISIKLQSNFLEIKLRHGFTSGNLLHFFRIPFTENTSGRLLLYTYLSIQLVLIT